MAAAADVFLGAVAADDLFFVSLPVSQNEEKRKLELGCMISNARTPCTTEKFIIFLYIVLYYMSLFQSCDRWILFHDCTHLIVVFQSNKGLENRFRISCSRVIVQN